MITGKHVIQLKGAQNEARWYKEEYDRLLAEIKIADEKIKTQSDFNADLSAKLDRYETNASDALKKKVARLTADAKAGANTGN